MIIKFDGTAINNEKVVGLSQKADLFDGSFKLGSTLCRVVELSVEHSYAESLGVPSDVVITDDSNSTLFTLIVDTIDKDNSDYWVYTLVDKMVLFNQPYYPTTETRTIGNHLTSISFGLADTGVQYLPSEIREISFKYKSGTIARDFISWVAELYGGFAWIDERGYLYFRRFKKSASTDAKTYDCEMDTCADYTLGELHEIAQITFAHDDTTYKSDYDGTIERRIVEIDNTNGNAEITGIGFMDANPLTSSATSQGGTVANPLTIRIADRMSYTTTGTNTQTESISFSPKIWGGNVDNADETITAKWIKITISKQQGSSPANSVDITISEYETDNPSAGNEQIIGSVYEGTLNGQEMLFVFFSNTHNYSNIVDFDFYSGYFANSLNYHYIDSDDLRCDIMDTHNYSYIYDQSGHPLSTAKGISAVYDRSINGLRIYFNKVSETLGLQSDTDWGEFANYLVSHPISVWMRVADIPISEHETVSFGTPTYHAPEEQFTVTVRPDSSVGGVSSASAGDVVTVVHSNYEGYGDKQKIEINPENQIIVYRNQNESIQYETLLNDILSKIEGYSFYSFRTSECEINQKVLAGDIVKFHDRVNGVSYPVIAQIDWQYNSKWLGGYDTFLDNTFQEETQYVTQTEKVLSLLNEKQDVLTFGAGIRNDNNTISNSFLSLSNVDLNTVNTNYQGYANSSCTNKPATGSGGSFSNLTYYQGNYGGQLFGSSATNKLYWRGLYNGTWKDWELLNDFYRSGDTLTLSNDTMLGAVIYSAKKAIAFDIPVAKLITASSVSCSSMTVGIYLYNGYVFGTSTNVVTDSTYSVNVSVNSVLNTVHVVITKTDGTAFTATSGTINNYCTASAYITGATFSFS